MPTRSALLAIGMIPLGGLLGYASASGQFTSLWQARAAARPGESDRLAAPGPANCSEGIEKALLLAHVGRTCCAKPSGRSHALSNALKAWTIGLVALLQTYSGAAVAS
jgi:hypothetical protein